MSCRVSKSRYRVKLSKALQEQLLDALAKQQVCAIASKPPILGKRRFDTSVDIDSVPTKRARLTPPNTEQPDAEQPGVEQQPDTEQLGIEQPQPQPANGPFASFLRDFVDPPQQTRPKSIVDTHVFEWLDSVGLDREEHCRSDSFISNSSISNSYISNSFTSNSFISDSVISDSFIYRSAGDSVPRRLTRSAPPAMDRKNDAEGFAVPPTPVSTATASEVNEGDSASALLASSIEPSDVTEETLGSKPPSGKNLVEGPLYRSFNLYVNGISMHHPCDPMPDHVASLLGIVSKNRDSTDPSSDGTKRDRALHDLLMGATEPEVEEYFHSHLFPKFESSDILQRTIRQPMSKHTTPNPVPKYRVSTPVPDIVYGYNPENAFPQPRHRLLSMGLKAYANNQALLYPFFIVEFKADGPQGSGSLWVATNQCLGGSASCVNIAEFLNKHMEEQCKTDKDKVNFITSAAFSIAMNGTDARLHISWKDDSNYRMAIVDTFALQRVEHYIEFRKYVLNIIDWGKGPRLEAIRS
ncbi:hypothetical protein F4777DRAFT_600047 [Nemania sp. FL0916]|nr:hypothetical protein F4777DRAFT_600047 [Nemania sp. FL0916]